MLWPPNIVQRLCSQQAWEQRADESGCQVIALLDVGPVAGQLVQQRCHLRLLLSNRRAALLLLILQALHLSTQTYRSFIEC